MTFCTSFAIVQKAGYGVNSIAAASSALLQQYSNDAMGFIIGMTRYDWIANSAAIGTNFKLILANAQARKAANDLISYDTSGYMGSSEADNLRNINYDEAMNLIKVLADKKLQNTMGVTNT